MGGLGLYIEDEGIATTQISLVRLHTETSNPPRALWVPFELGRPFGAPNDPEFQTRVLRNALDLLEADAGPLIVDYPEDAPAPTEEELEGWACPVSFGSPEDADDDSLAGALRREIGQLAPWYDLAVERRGRTMVGVSGFEIEDAGDYLLSFLETPPTVSPRDGLTPGDVLKLACDDLKSFYLEAITAQPSAAGRPQLEEWFWNSTTLADVYLALQPICLASDDHTMRGMGLHTLVPRTQTLEWVDEEG